jgi:hypothetical protein
MNQLKKRIVGALALSMIGLVAVAHAQRGTTVTGDGYRTSDGSDGTRAGTTDIINQVPMVDWLPAQKITRRVAADGQKAATDVVSIYRPVPLCRLMDSRAGQPSALGTNGGLLTANNGRIIATAGACGIPTSQVAALSVSFVTQNTTVNNGGYITFIPTVGSPVAGTNLVFNPGAEWGGTTANVSTANNGGFVAFVAQSNVHLIVDINGYYQDINELDSDTQTDITGASTGDIFAVTNTSSGGALVGANSTAGGTAIRAVGANGTTSTNGSTALRISGGKLAVTGVSSGSSVSSGATVFTHTVSAASIDPTCPARSNIDHVMLNGVPNARIIAIGYLETGVGTSGPSVVAGEYVGAGNSCAANQHRLHFSANAVVGSKYTVMVISP